MENKNIICPVTELECTRASCNNISPDCIHDINLLASYTRLVKLAETLTGITEESANSRSLIDKLIEKRAKDLKIDIDEFKRKLDEEIARGPNK